MGQGVKSDDGLVYTSTCGRCPRCTPLCIFSVKNRPLDNPPTLLSLSSDGSQEPTENSTFGRSRRHFHPTRESATGNIGNDHYSSPPAVLPPNKDREGSFKSLKESRAAGSGLGGRSGVGPSDENRVLRSALLSRTFDSQIFFGSSEGEEEALGRYQRSGAPGTDDGRPPPPPAGGGRVGRVAEGAAWTPGGRRLIPGSKAFISHLGSGMMARKDASAEEDDEEARSTTSSNSMLLSARKSRARAAARAPPVWIPKPDPKSSMPVAVAADTCGDVAVNGGRLSGSISLAQLMDGGGDSHSGHGRDQHKPSGGISPHGQHPAPSPSTPTVDRNGNIKTREKNDNGRCSGQPPVHVVTKKERAFDWWGGAGVSDTDTGRERAVGSSVSKPRPKSVSDTYKSSLVFG